MRRRGTAEVVVLGSQAVLAQFPRAPDEVTYSREVDVFVTGDEPATDLIDGVLGELSHCSETHGFYVHGVGPETVVVPDGWRERLIPLLNENTRGCTGWCLEAHISPRASWSRGARRTWSTQARCFATR
jgi:hypothetical protein